MFTYKYALFLSLFAGLPFAAPAPRALAAPVEAAALAEDPVIVAAQTRTCFQNAELELTRRNLRRALELYELAAFGYERLADIGGQANAVARQGEVLIRLEQPIQ